MENSNLIEINKENIQKALNFLGLDVNPFKDINKGNDGELKSAPEPGGGKKEDINKPEIFEEENGEIKEKENKETPLEEKKKKEEQEEKKPEEEVIIKAEVDNLVKAEVNKIQKAFTDTFEKAIDEIKNSFREELQIIKSEFTKGFQTTNEKFKSVGILEKEQMESINKLNSRLKTLEEQPNPRKSAIVKSIHDKNFENNNEFEQKDPTKTYYSLSGNRKEILSMLKEKSNIDGVSDLSQANQLMVKGLEMYEASGNFGSFSKAITESLSKEGIVFIK